MVLQGLSEQPRPRPHRTPAARAKWWYLQDVQSRRAFKWKTLLLHAPGFTVQHSPMKLGGAVGKRAPAASVTEKCEHDLPPVVSVSVYISFAQISLTPLALL